MPVPAAGHVRPLSCRRLAPCVPHLVLQDWTPARPRDVPSQRHPAISVPCRLQILRCLGFRGRQIVGDCPVDERRQFVHRGVFEPDCRWFQVRHRDGLSRANFLAWNYEYQLVVGNDDLIGRDEPGGAVYLDGEHCSARSRAAVERFTQLHVDRSVIVRQDVCVRDSRGRRVRLGDRPSGRDQRYRPQDDRAEGSPALPQRCSSRLACISARSRACSRVVGWRSVGIGGGVHAHRSTGGLISHARGLARARAIVRKHPWTSPTTKSRPCRLHGRRWPRCTRMKLLQRTTSARAVRPR